MSEPADEYDAAWDDLRRAGDCSFCQCKSAFALPWRPWLCGSFLESRTGELPYWLLHL